MRVLIPIRGGPCDGRTESLLSSMAALTYIGLPYTIEDSEGPITYLAKYFVRRNTEGEVLFASFCQA